MTIKVDKKKGEICISLNKKFYEIKIIKNSLADFKEVCKGKIKKHEGKDIIIMLKPLEIKMTDCLGHEFCNYALGLMKNKIIV